MRKAVLRLKDLETGIEKEFGSGNAEGGKSKKVRSLEGEKV
jgi:hypothetical protein